MLLILEIILTIAAWKRGWKGWALLPAAAGLWAAFFAGVVIGLAGGSEENLFPVGIIFDLLIVGALIVMTSKRRRAGERRQGVTQPAPETNGNLPAALEASREIQTTPGERAPSIMTPRSRETQ